MISKDNTMTMASIRKVVEKLKRHSIDPNKLIAVAGVGIFRVRKNGKYSIVIERGSKYEEVVIVSKMSQGRIQYTHGSANTNR